MCEYGVLRVQGDTQHDLNFPSRLQMMEMDQKQSVLSSFQPPMSVLLEY